MTVSDVSSAKPIQAAEMPKPPPPPVKGHSEGDGKGSPHSAGLMNIKA